MSYVTALRAAQHTAKFIARACATRLRRAHRQRHVRGRRPEPAELVAYTLTWRAKAGARGHASVTPRNHSEGRGRLQPRVQTDSGVGQLLAAQGRAPRGKTVTVVQDGAAQLTLNSSRKTGTQLLHKHGASCVVPPVVSCWRAVRQRLACTRRAPLSRHAASYLASVVSQACTRALSSGSCSPPTITTAVLGASASAKAQAAAATCRRSGMARPERRCGVYAGARALATQRGARRRSGRLAGYETAVQEMQCRTSKRSVRYADAPGVPHRAAARQRQTEPALLRAGAAAMAANKGALTTYVPNVVERVSYESAMVEHKPLAGPAVRARWLRRACGAALRLHALACCGVRRRACCSRRVPHTCVGCRATPATRCRTWRRSLSTSMTLCQRASRTCRAGAKCGAEDA